MTMKQCLQCKHKLDVFKGGVHCRLHNMQQVPLEYVDPNCPDGPDKEFWAELPQRYKGELKI